MCVSIDIVRAERADCGRCKEAIIIVKFASVKCWYIEEEFVVISTLG